MENISEYRSWFWVLKSWVIVYAVLLVVGILLGFVGGPSYYWSVMAIGSLIMIVPITYRNLVGGGCSFKFQMCALVKGMVAGLIFLILSMVADFVLWGAIGTSFGWTPLGKGSVSWSFYQVWWFSGAIGGFGARIAEVRAYDKRVGRNITIIDTE